MKALARFGGTNTSGIKKKIDARSARGQMKGESALVKCVHVFFFPEQETTFNHLPSTLSFHEILKGKNMGSGY